MKEINKCSDTKLNVFDEHRKANAAKRIEYYKNPSIAYCKPFRIIGDLYYIGDKKVCSYLINTGDGLIIFDTGYSHTIHLLVQCIWELGFNPSDIRYIVHTHAHHDHFGGSNEFRSLYGCKTLMSRLDTEMLRGNHSGALMDLNPMPYAGLPVIDQTFEDGEVITLGNTSIKCVLTPGHTPGNTTFFFDVRDNERIYRVGYFGGRGVMTMTRAFLDKYGFPYSLRDDFQKSIDKIRFEHVDIVITSHPSHSNMMEKRSIMMKQTEINPFIDPSEWEKLMNVVLTKYKDMVDKNY